MTKREKVIVGVMCLTIVYGAYELLGTRGSKKSVSAPASPAAVKNNPVNPTEETRKFATEMTQKLVAERMGTDARHIVDQSTAEWSKDPFIQSTRPLDSKSADTAGQKKMDQKTEPATTFAFTGFLQVGKTRLAIINGMEYAVGDTIGATGHYLESITAEGVVIGAANGEKIQLTLSETD